MNKQYIKFIIGEGRTEKWRINQSHTNFYLRKGDSKASKTVYFTPSNAYPYQAVSALIFKEDEGTLWEYVD